MWDVALLADAAARALRDEAGRLDEEQSPYGLDALDELRVHPILRRGLADAGFTVLAEQRYPADRSTRRRSQGDRCDIVLLDPEHAHLTDPLATGTLFGGAGAPPEDALWIEVKLARQFSIFDTGAGPDPGYAGQLLREAVGDVRRLASAPGVVHAASLLVLFTRDEETARHDLVAWANRCLDKGLLIDRTAVDAFPITDRIGNACCAVAVTRVRG